MFWSQHQRFFQQMWYVNFVALAVHYVYLVSWHFFWFVLIIYIYSDSITHVYNLLHLNVI